MGAPPPGIPDQGPTPELCAHLILGHPQSCLRLLTLHTLFVLFSLIHFLLYLIINLAALGLCCCTQAFSSCGELGYCSPVAGSLQPVGSVVVVDKLSCPHRMWNLPRPGIKPASPALASVFLATRPPRKTQNTLIFPDYILLPRVPQLLEEWLPTPSAPLF